MQIGDLIKFTYPAVHQQGTEAHDRYPTVLVLHTNWQGLVHGLNFNYLTGDEINVIRMILDPMFEMRYRDALRSRNPRAYAELEKIITAPIAGTQGFYGRVRINSPQGFYTNVIKPFISARGYDPYRKYSLAKMTGIRVVQTAARMMGEDSWQKFKTEKEEIANALKLAKERGKANPTEVAKIDSLERQLKESQNMVQRKSLLEHFADFTRFHRGPRGPTF